MINIQRFVSSLRKLGKCISQGQKLAIAKSAVENPTLLPHIVSHVAVKLKQEMKTLSSIKHSSILQMKSKDAMESYCMVLFYYNLHV